MKVSTYTCPVGADDQKRLQTLNNICNPHTLEFIERSYLDLSGNTILDVGCGIGVLTVELAKKVGPTGKIYAIDISKEQLAVAKRYAEKCGLSNIEFVCQDVTSLDAIDYKADLVYTRFLLEHLKEPVVALQNMIHVIKKGGYLFCENVVSYDAMFCVPDRSVYQEWKQAVMLQPKLYDTNFFIGKDLYHQYINNGLEPVNYQLQQPLINNVEDRIQFHLITQSKVMQQLLVEKGYYTKEKLSQVTMDVIDLMQQDTLVAFPQYIQILGKKNK